MIIEDRPRIAADGPVRFIEITSQSLWGKKLRYLL